MPFRQENLMESKRICRQVWPRAFVKLILMLKFAFQIWRMILRNVGCILEAGGSAGKKLLPCCPHSRKLKALLYDKVSRQTHPKHQLLLEPGLCRCIWQGSWSTYRVIRRVFIFN